MKNLPNSQKGLLVFLVLVLAYAAFDFVKNKDTYLSFYGKNTSGKRTVLTAPDSINRDAQNATVKKYSKDWAMDPFYTEPPQKIRAVRRPAQESFHLKAISFAGENSVAMINDKIVSVGEWIGQYKVLKIEADRVILGDGAKSKILSLK